MVHSSNGLDDELRTIKPVHRPFVIQACESELHEQDPVESIKIDRRMSSQSLSFDDVADFFSLPLYDAATTLGVCASSLKKVCRENGLERWPYRKFLAGKSIEEIKKDAARISKLHRQRVQSQIIEQSNLQRAQQPTSSPQTLIEGMALSDEFKHGFPSEGLSVVTNKWWGSGQADESEGTGEDGARDEGEQKLLSDDKADNKDIDKRMDKRKGNMIDTSLQGAALLKSIRERIAEDGQRALELGVHRRYGARKLDRRQQTLLRKIFKSSLDFPKDWLDASSHSYA